MTMTQPTQWVKPTNSGCTWFSNEALMLTDFKEQEVALHTVVITLLCKVKTFYHKKFNLFCNHLCWQCLSLLFDDIPSQGSVSRVYMGWTSLMVQDLIDNYCVTLTITSLWGTTACASLSLSTVSVILHPITYRVMLLKPLYSEPMFIDVLISWSHYRGPSECS